MEKNLGWEGPQEFNVLLKAELTSKLDQVAQGFEIFPRIDITQPFCETSSRVKLLFQWIVFSKCLYAKKIY